jgi:HEAT repeat protein
VALSSTGGFGCCSESDLPNFKKGLYSSVAKERNSAALGLAKCGEKASDSVSRLGQLLYDENVGVQSSAAYALRKIDTEAARTLLQRAESARAARREKSSR